MIFLNRIFDEFVGSDVLYEEFGLPLMTMCSITGFGTSRSKNFAGNTMAMMSRLVIRTIAVNTASADVRHKSEKTICDDEEDD